METHENIKEQQPVVSIIKGKGDIMQQFGDVIKSISRGDTESAYVLIRFIDNTFNFKKIEQGTDGEVSVDFSRLTLQRGILGYEVYHNHPSGGPPSNDDFMVVANTKKYITHRVITREGVWSISLGNETVAKTHAQKLGSLFTYLHGVVEGDVNQKLHELNSIHKSYGKIAQSYERFEKNTANKEDFIKLKAGMQDLGFDINFLSYTP